MGAATFCLLCIRRFCCVQQLRAVTERDKPEHKVAAPVDGRIGFRISSPPEAKFSWRKAFRRLNFSDFSRAIVTVPFIQPGAKNKKGVTKIPFGLIKGMRRSPR